MVAGPAGKRDTPLLAIAIDAVKSTAMTIPDHLLDILCCPVSHQPLLPLTGDKLKRINRAIATGEIQNVDHEIIRDPLQSALITRDQKVIYPIVDGIPVLIAENGIGTTQLKQPL